MKTQISKWLLSIILTAFVATNLYSQDLSVDEILQKSVEARGGKELLSSIKSSVTKTSMTSPMGAIVTTSYMKDKEASYTLIEIGDKKGLGNKKGYTLMRKKDGVWTASPSEDLNQAPKHVTNKASMIALDLEDPFIDYENRGSFATLIGIKNIDGEDCYNIAMVFSDGSKKNYYISTKSFYIIKEVEKNENGEDGISFSYSNFKKLDSGYVYASKISTDIGAEKPFEKTVESVKINVNIPEDLFKLPSEK